MVSSKVTLWPLFVVCVSNFEFIFYEIFERKDFLPGFCEISDQLDFEIQRESFQSKKSFSESTGELLDLGSLC